MKSFEELMADMFVALNPQISFTVVLERGPVINGGSVHKVRIDTKYPIRNKSPLWGHGEEFASYVEALWSAFVMLRKQVSNNWALLCV